MKLAFPVATPETSDATMLALRGNLAENFRLLAKLGYDAVELMVRDPASLNAVHIKTLADDLGLAISSVSTGQLRKEDDLQLCHPEHKPRAYAVARTEEVIEFTAAVQARQINIGTLRGYLPDGPQRAEGLVAARESIGHLLDYAAERGVGIALEPQNRFIINWLNSVEETLNWMKQFPQPNLSVLFDAYHALFEEPSFYAGLIQAFPRISYLQVADSNRQVPGLGQVNFADFMRVLRALGYTGYISVEVLQRPTGAEAAAMAIRSLRPLIEQQRG